MELGAREPELRGHRASRRRRTLLLLRALTTVGVAHPGAGDSAPEPLEPTEDTVPTADFPLSDCVATVVDWLPTPTADCRLTVTADSRLPTGLCSAVLSGLNSNQKRGLFAAWGGVALDGVDSFIYALVLVPAMRDLLPRSGIAPTTGNLGLYGSVLFAAFLIGWGLAFVWGPLADRYGRVRMLMLAILCYSLFTFLGAFAHNWWMLAVFRLLAGFGIGGEFVGAATFVAEELPESRRVLGAGIMNSGYYVGNLIAAILNYTVGASYGWRVMFAIGGLPALFVAYVRASVQEPERWRNRRQQIGPWRAQDSFLLLFSPEYRRQTILNCIFVLISMIGLWAGSVYAASAVTELAQRQGYTPQAAALVASQATMLLACGTIAACLLMPWMVESRPPRCVGGVLRHHGRRRSRLALAWRSI